LYSINELRSILLKLPVVPSDRISFKRISRAASRFESNFAETIPCFLSLLRANELFETHPPAVTQALIQQQLNKIVKHKQALEDLKKGDEAVAVEIGKKYNKDIVTAEAKKVKERMAKYEKKATEFEQDAKEIENGSPIAVHKVAFEERGLHPTKRVQWSSDIPFKAKVLRLGEKTYKERVDAEKDCEYDVTFAAGGKGNQAIVGSALIGSTILALGVSYFSGGQASVSGVIPELNKFVTDANTVVCEGEVQFLVDRKNVPEHAQTIKRLTREADSVRDTVDDLKQQLQEILQAESSGLNGIVTQMLKNDELEKSTLEQFEQFRATVQQLMNSQKKFIRYMYCIGRVLYDENERGTNTQMFMAMYKELTEGKKKQANVDDLIKNAQIEDFVLGSMKDELISAFAVQDK